MTTTASAESQDTTRPFVRACIALGSNLGDRAATLESAIETLRRVPGVRVLAVSSWIETEPVGPPGQGLYLNGAAVLETSLPARNLLGVLLETERAHGRERSPDPAQRWGARELDLDLIIFGDLAMDEPGLTVPHPRLAERAFVLAPLAEIAPDARVPMADGSRVTVRALLARLGSVGG